MDIRSGGAACWAAPLDVEPPPPLDVDDVSPATVFSLQLVGGVLFLVPAVVSSPLVGGGVLLPAAELSPLVSPLVGGGALPPAPTSLSAADILSPPARVAFALAAAAALLPVWPDSRHFEVLFSSAAAD
ncbi:hypothetical protein HZS61_011285 [Fusarium oxysporum f. sp. conglutinans]|uniref:Uncharacterized protein n=1 Tax=Fusarium oxysporum f. sp. conglutinans TaxID=100902 RepID=A0A8H6GXW2_FUSOX|nr:hypothetical protein HZS61_011285 [Fusarium oxysporum f. sp. conglutinans]